MQTLQCRAIQRPCWSCSMLAARHLQHSGQMQASTWKRLLSSSVAAAAHCRQQRLPACKCRCFKQLHTPCMDQHDGLVLACMALWSLLGLLCLGPGSRQGPFWRRTPFGTCCCCGCCGLACCIACRLASWLGNLLSWSVGCRLALWLLLDSSGLAGLPAQLVSRSAGKPQRGMSCTHLWLRPFCRLDRRWLLLTVCL